MKLKRFLSKYKNTSTSLTRDLPAVRDASRLTDHSFTTRQKIDRRRKIVGRYVDSQLVRPTFGVRPSSAIMPASKHDVGEKKSKIAASDIPRPKASSAGPPRPKNTSGAKGEYRHRFVEPASRGRPR